MEIISSQPFLIVFYRKVLLLFRFREKTVFRKACPVRRDLFLRKKRALSLFHHSLFPFLKHPVQKIGETCKYSHHHEKKRIGDDH